MPQSSPVFIIEAALLAAKSPLDIRTLRRLFDDELSAKTIRQHLRELQRFWEDRALRLEELSDGCWRFRTAEEIQPNLLKLIQERPQRYSRAALETLAIIAYRQPVTRGDIEALRGVAVNPTIIRQFEDRGWIETVGFRETPGRPALLGTTKTFLADFGLKSLADLPSIDAVPDEEFALGDLNPASNAPIGAIQTQEELDFGSQK